MNVLSKYLSHINGFSEIYPNAISSKYSMFMFTNTGDNCDPIASPSSRQYMSDLIPKCVVFTQKVNISIRLSIEINVRFSSEGSAVNLPCTTV